MSKRRSRTSSPDPAAVYAGAVRLAAAARAESKLFARAGQHCLARLADEIELEALRIRDGGSA